jgi:hypothetical protein
MAEVGLQRARVVAPVWFVVLVCSTIRSDWRKLLSPRAFLNCSYSTPAAPPKSRSIARAIHVRKFCEQSMGMYRSPSAGIRLVSSRRTHLLAFMGDVHTLLLPVQEGEIWRVQIVWPNGAVRYFGKFTSEHVFGL